MARQAPRHAHLAAVTERPMSLKVLCGIWGVFGAFEILRCLLGFGDLIRFQIAGANPSYPAELSRMLPTAIAAGYVLTLIYMAIAVLVFVSAFHLWKLRSWARKSLEAASWCGLVLVIGVGIFAITMFLEMTSRMPAHARDEIDWIGWVALAIVMTLSIALGISIGVLRSHKVREAIASAQVDAGDAVMKQRLPYEVPSLPG